MTTHHTVAELRALASVAYQHPEDGRVQISQIHWNEDRVSATDGHRLLYVETATVPGRDVGVMAVDVTKALAGFSGKEEVFIERHGEFMELTVRSSVARPITIRLRQAGHPYPSVEVLIKGALPDYQRGSLPALEGQRLMPFGIDASYLEHLSQIWKAFRRTDRLIECLAAAGPREPIVFGTTVIDLAGDREDVARVLIYVVMPLLRDVLRSRP